MNKKTKNQKGLILIFFVIVFSFLFLSPKNKSLKNVFAQDPSEDTGDDYIESEFICDEIPIGRAVDQAEYIAQKIIDELEVLAEKTKQVRNLAQEMIELSDDCSIDNCVPKCETITVGGGCPTSGCTPGYTCNYKGYSHTGAEIIANGWSRKNCNGLPSDLSINPTANYSIFEYKHNITGDSGWCNIKCAGTSTKHEPKPCQNLQGNTACPPKIKQNQNEIKSVAVIISEILGKVAQFASEMQFAFEKLQISRNKLADCVVRPFEETALERGELSGKALISCQDALDMKIDVQSILDEELQQGCYGNLYCYVKIKEKGEKIPYVYPPCAEDYYCCDY